MTSILRYCRLVCATCLLFAMMASGSGCSKKSHLGPAMAVADQDRTETALAREANPKEDTETLEPVGRLVAWPETDRKPSLWLCSGIMKVRVDSGGQWVAVLDSTGHVRVWKLMQEMSLGGLLWDSLGADYVIRDISWIGQRLGYWQVQGPKAFSEFWDGDPRTPNPYGDDPRKYERTHSQTWVFDPNDGTQKLLLETASGVLLADKAGTTLVLADATFAWDESMDNRHQVTSVNVFFMPHGKPVGAFVADIGDHMLGTTFAGPFVPHPLFSAGDGGKYFFAEGAVEGPGYPGSPGPISKEAVAVIGLDGTVQFLTDGAENSLLPYLPGFPAVVRLADGQTLVACMLYKWRSLPWRLVYYAPDGRRVREYSFGLTYGILNRFIGKKTSWRPITVTPDGKYLLVHDTGERSHLREGEKGWLWMWDLEAQEGKPVARLEEITAVYGWVRDEFLLLQLDREHVEGRTVTTDNHGALYVPWKSRETVSRGGK